MIIVSMLLLGLVSCFNREEISSINDVYISEVLEAHPDLLNITFTHSNTVGLDYSVKELVVASDLYRVWMDFKLTKNLYKIVNDFIPIYRAIFIENLDGLYVSKYFYKFRRILIEKCKENNVLLIFVDAKNTSKICNLCQHKNLKNPLLTNSKNFKCGYCGYIVDKDLNAALNIQDRGLSYLQYYGFKVDTSLKKTPHYYGYYRIQNS